MINIHPSDKPILITGCMGGTLTGLCNASFTHDLLHNIGVTALGAVVSVTVSYLLNLLFKKWKR